MKKSRQVKAGALVAAALALGAACGGTSWADANPVPDRQACDRFSSANACEHAGTRVKARDVEWAQAEIVLRDVQNEAHTIDLGAAGPSPGDVIVFENILWNSTGTTAVGRFVSRCVQLTDAMHQCQGTLIFARGTIELSTATALGADIVASVTGGTGEHAGARGQALIVPTGTAGTSRITVDLQDR